MTTTALDDGIATRILEEEDSNKALLVAVKSSSPIQLRADADCEEQTLLGIIVGGTETQLEVEISTLDHCAHAILSSPVLFASVDMGECRYVFKTQCISTIVESDTDVLHLVRPAAIAVVERRRSRRREFRKPTELILHTSGSNADQRLCAQMLNLSVSGLACKMHEPDTLGALRAGDSVRIAFDFGKPARTFDLTGRVITRTPAGTPGYVVVGMEFVEDGCLDASRKRLREVLAQPD